MNSDEMFLFTFRKPTPRELVNLLELMALYTHACSDYSPIEATTRYYSMVYEKIEIRNLAIEFMNKLKNELLRSPYPILRELSLMSRRDYLTNLFQYFASYFSDMNLNEDFIFNQFWNVRTFISLMEYILNTYDPSSTPRAHQFNLFYSSGSLKFEKIRELIDGHNLKWEHHRFENGLDRLRLTGLFYKDDWDLPRYLKSPETVVVLSSGIAHLDYLPLDTDNIIAIVPNLKSTDYSPEQIMGEFDRFVILSRNKQVNIRYGLEDNDRMYADYITDLIIRKKNLDLLRDQEKL